MGLAKEHGRQHLRHVLTVTAATMLCSALLVAGGSISSGASNLYFYDGNTKNNVWHTNTVSSTYNGAGATTWSGGVAYIDVPGVGTSSAVTTVTMTFSKRAVNNTRCKWNYTNSGVSGLKCRMIY
jgi:hypothetical protein